MIIPDVCEKLFLEYNKSSNVIDCFYFFMEEDIHHFVLSIESHQDHRYLRIVRQQEGGSTEANAVQLPFGFLDLWDRLVDLPEAKDFLAILNVDGSTDTLDNIFRSLSLPLGKMIALTRFFRYRYPPAYLHIIGCSERIYTETRFEITRDMIAQYLNVPHLTHGQMSALRRLEGYRHWHEAIDIIVNRWDAYCHRLPQSEPLNINGLILMDAVVRFYPALLRERWFCLKNLAGWNNLSNSVKSYQDTSVTHARCLVLHWLILKEFDIKTGSIPDADEMSAESLYVIWNTMERYGDAENSLDDLYAAVLQRCPANSRDQYAVLLKLILDDYSAARRRQNFKVSDETPMPKATAILPDTFFTRIETAGEMYAMGSQLKNCAASLVASDIYTRLREYWRYVDDLNRDQAMLSISICGDCLSIVFRGCENAPPSSLARERCVSWMLANGYDEVSSQANGDSTYKFANI